MLALVCGCESMTELSMLSIHLREAFKRDCGGGSTRRLLSIDKLVNFALLVGRGASPSLRRHHMGFSRSIIIKPPLPSTDNTSKQERDRAIDGLGLRVSSPLDNT